ncbi:hypothetical protein FRB97_006132 [Tulasnella sp. 331]|nr:hypothetical protein FRB97_006132 [Tulasnella sp. 331]
MAQQEVILITGGNTGLGFQIVRALCNSDKPYHIILGGRSLSKVQDAIRSVEGEFPSSVSKLFPLQVDIEHDDSIQNAFEEIQFKPEDSIRVQLELELVAGRMTEREMWNRTWNVNTTGTQVMTIVFIPLLLQSSNPRLLFITSGTPTLTGTENSALPANKISTKGWPKSGVWIIPAYRSSKAGLNMMTREWHRMFHEDGVKVWAIPPGFIATGIGAGLEFNKKAGAGNPSSAGVFIRSVVEGGRDADVGKVVTSSGVQPCLLINLNDAELAAINNSVGTRPGTCPSSKMSHGKPPTVTSLSIPIIPTTPLLPIVIRSINVSSSLPNFNHHPLAVLMARKRKFSTVVKAEETKRTTVAPATLKKTPHTKRHKVELEVEADSPPTSADEDAPMAPTPSASIRRSARARKTKAMTYAESSESDSDPKTSADSPKVVEDQQAKDVHEEDYAQEEEDVPKTKRQKNVKLKTPKAKLANPDPAANADDNGDAQGTPTKTTRKRKAIVVEPVVYDIPDVERKETTFKGRLGYACLNTILRNAKPDPIFCSRTCRIATIKEKGMDFVKELGLQNARDLLKMIEWNETNKIRFMRMSSEMFPFASHAEYGYDLSFAEKELKEAGDLAKKYGHRLTMHPGQFTQLGSPKDAVVESSIKELQYQCEIMDRMGLDQDSVMIIHGGGVYGDKEAALARFKDNYTTKLPENVKARLVLENDELCYNLDDLMPMCEELEIPIIVDYHHDWIYPSSRPLTELIPIVNKTWEKKGIKVKQHLSEPRPGAVTPMEKRAHADRCQVLPPGLPDDADLMIEAKDKEQAVFELRRIYGLDEVIWENLRPPNKDQTLATGGRKSTKTRKKNVGNDEPGGEDVVLEGEGKEGDETAIVE